MSPIVREAHRWIAAAYVPLDEVRARYAFRRGTVRVRAETKVEALEVMCAECRRPFEEADGEPCVLGNWLHGGPIDERKRAGADDGRLRDGTDDAEAVAASA